MRMKSKPIRLVSGLLALIGFIGNPCAHARADAYHVLEFSGDGDYVQLDHNDSIDLTESFTFATWVYVRSWTSPFHQFGGKGDTSWMLRRERSGNDVRLSLRGLEEDFEGRTTTWEMPFYEWVHLALTFCSGDGRTRFYVNGEGVLEETHLEGTLNNNESPLVVGAHKEEPGSERRFHDGYMSDIRLYDRALSDEEITHVWKKSQDVTDGLVVHWKLGEGSGNVAHDSSGLDNHGEIVRGSWKAIDAPFWGKTVPDLHGLSQKEAQLALEDAGFAVGDIMVLNAEGRVVQQSAHRAPDGFPIDFVVNDAVRLIFDTDMDTDCDDAAALAMVHALADLGEAEILATLVSSQYPWSVGAAQAINGWYGRLDLPIGSPLLGEGAHPRRGSRFARQLAEEFDPPFWSNTQAADAVEVYRRVLAKQPDNSVVIVTVGYITNMRHLLDSEPCEHSPLAGEELVAQKVREWVCMGSRYPADRDPGVWGNFKPDPKATVEAVTRWPTQITFTGGGDFAWSLATGEVLCETPQNNPVRRAYELYFGGECQNRHSADQIAVLVAVRGADHPYWDLVTEGHNHIFPNGTHEWRETPDEPRHRYISALADGVTTEEVIRTFEELMGRPPGKLVFDSSPCE